MYSIKCSNELTGQLAAWQPTSATLRIFEVNSGFGLLQIPAMALHVALMHTARTVAVFALKDLKVTPISDANRFMIVSFVSQVMLLDIFTT